jgi:hypothetical protein
MAIDWLFRKAAPVTPDQFWNQVSAMCAQHVSRTLDSFRKRGFPEVDTSACLYAALWKPEEIQRLIRMARAQYEATRETPSVDTIDIATTEEWHIRACVYPSAADRKFLAACHSRRFEELLFEAKRQFRANDPEWSRVRFALWVLELDQPRNAACVALHTDWSLQDKLQKFRRERAMDGRMVTVFEFPPTIMAADLLRTAPDKLVREMLEQDLSDLRQSSNPFDLSCDV